VNVNLNIIIQTKEKMEIEKKKAKDKQGREAYGVISQIESQISENVNLISSTNTNNEQSNVNRGLMRTLNFSDINRFSN
jgi:hypothetical protein